MELETGNKLPPEARIRELFSAFQNGSTEQALLRARAMVTEYPAFGLGWKAKASALAQLGKHEDALGAFATAVQCLPDDAELHHLGAKLLCVLGRADEARLSYERALQLNPTSTRLRKDFAATLSDLGATRQAQAQVEAARDFYLQALALDPDCVPALNNLGTVYAAQGPFLEAEACFEHALRLSPSHADARSNLAASLQDLGRIEEARQCYQKALELAPASHRILSNLLLCTNYAELDPNAYLDLARTYADLVGSRLQVSPAPVPSLLPGAKIRLGFISGDLREHPVGYFLEAVLRKLDRSRLCVVAFPTVEGRDPLASRLRECADEWIPIATANPRQAADDIAQRDIHILLDLSGHTSNNALPVLARRPAPVQASWLGYFASTGVPAMDYLIADRLSVPQSHAWHFTEKIRYLPQTRLCFTEPESSPPVSPLPARSSGVITFASFAYLAKIGDPVLALWARLMSAVPSSRLLLKSKQLGDPAVQDLVAKRFAQVGISRDRLVFEGHSDRLAYLRAYERVDIVLDTFPFTGATTTMEALWMGVPVLSLAGERMVARQGKALLINADLPDWVADSPQEYLEKGMRHCSDLGSLERLRGGLRERLRSSPLMDSTAFARDLETLLLRLWEEHVQASSDLQQPS